MGEEMPAKGIPRGEAMGWIIGLGKKGQHGPYPTLSRRELRGQSSSKAF